MFIIFFAKLQKKKQKHAIEKENPENKQVVLGIYIDLLYSAIIVAL